MNRVEQWHSVAKVSPVNRDYEEHYDVDGVSFPTEETSDAKSKKNSTMAINRSLSVSKVDLGMEEKDRQKIADSVSRLLADSYVLSLKTQNFHWNVKGPMFHSLHLLFQGQYEDLAKAVDLIAERIRALGFAAPATFHEFEALTTIKSEKDAPTADLMVARLCADHESVIRTARKGIQLADGFCDFGTADLLTQRIAAHEKAAWMLRSLLG